MPPSALRSSLHAHSRAGKRPLNVAEQRRHRRVAAQGGAVHFDKRAAGQFGGPVLVHKADGRRLARAGRAVVEAEVGERGRIATRSIYSIIRLKHGLRVAPVPDFRKLSTSPPARRPGGDVIVAAEIRVNNRHVARAMRGFIFCAAARSALIAPVWHSASRNQQSARRESAGGDMNRMIFIFRDEGMAAGEIVRAGVNLFEVPRVADRDFYADDFRFRRRRWRYPSFNRFKQRASGHRTAVRAVNDQRLLLARAQSRAPFFPTLTAASLRQSRTVPTNQKATVFTA